MSNQKHSKLVFLIKIKQLEWSNINLTGLKSEKKQINYFDYIKPKSLFNYNYNFINFIKKCVLKIEVEVVVTNQVFHLQGVRE